MHVTNIQNVLQVLLKCTIPFHTIQFIHTLIAIRLLAFCAQCTPSSSFQITFPDTRSQIHFLIGFYSLADIQLAILGADYVISDFQWMSGNFDSLRSSPTAGTRDCHWCCTCTFYSPVSWLTGPLHCCAIQNLSYPPLSCNATANPVCQHSPHLHHQILVSTCHHCLHLDCLCIAQQELGHMLDLSIIQPSSQLLSVSPRIHTVPKSSPGD